MDGWMGAHTHVHTCAIMRWNATRLRRKTRKNERYTANQPRLSGNVLRATCSSETATARFATQCVCAWPGKGVWVPTSGQHGERWDPSAVSTCGWPDRDCRMAHCRSAQGTVVFVQCAHAGGWTGSVGWSTLPHIRTAQRLWNLFSVNMQVAVFDLPLPSHYDGATAGFIQRTFG
eukprot:363916-Chlamydomonas_euryale.AAC.7